MTEPLPTTIGRYQVREVIGRGMMGIVYRAHDPELDRLVALKTVRLAFAVSDEEQAQYEKRFLAEARAAAALSHPGIVTVHDVGRDAASGVLYIALEHLQGRDLHDLTRDGRPWEGREALRLIARLAEALHHAHAQGIVHRDIKPANIMVLPSGEPKIMDFGIAKVPAARLTAAGELFGTPLYMSPEQASGLPVDGRSDLFSLGAVLYLLLTGRTAFEAEGLPAILARVTRHDPPPPTTVALGLPPGVDAVVARALAKEPDRRYADGRAFADDLADVMAGRPPRHASPAPPAAASVHGVAAGAGWPRYRSRVLAAGGTVAALAALLLAGIGPAVGPSPAEAPAVPPPVAPAGLEVELEHPLKRGMLRVWIDDDLAIEEPLESRVTRKVLFVKSRRGRAEKLLEVAPGERSIRVQVEGGGFNETLRIRGTFTSGATRRLEARVEGLLSKELKLAWR